MNFIGLSNPIQCSSPSSTLEEEEIPGVDIDYNGYEVVVEQLDNYEVVVEPLNEIVQTQDGPAEPDSEELMRSDDEDLENDEYDEVTGIYILFLMVGKPF